MELLEYKQHKREILEHMCIKLTSTEKKHLESLQTEIQIDNYVRSLIMDRL